MRKNKGYLSGEPDLLFFCICLSLFHVFPVYLHFPMELIPIKVVKQCLKLFLFWFGDKNPLLYRPLSLTSFINCSNCVVHIVVHLALLPVWLLSTKLDYILKYISVYFQRNFFSFLCFFPFLCLYCFLNLFSSFPVLLFVSFCCFLSWSLISLFHLG